MKLFHPSLHTWVCSGCVLFCVSMYLYIMTNYGNVFTYITEVIASSNSSAMGLEKNYVEIETTAMVYGKEVIAKSSWRQSAKKLSNVSIGVLNEKETFGGNSPDELPEKDTLKIVLTDRGKVASKLNGNKTEEKINQIRIGILIPTCTRKLKNPVLETVTLATICLPSIYKTLEDKYVYQIYIGIDKGDYLESVQHNLTKLFSNITTVIGPGKTFTKAVNAMARKAYEDGMDYLVRINDDTSFETKKWTSLALDVLLKYNPPNIGVVGPVCKQGNTQILTHDMVHRIHIKIFGFYYPLYFENWWSDTWITQVYQPNRSTKLASWIVKHHNSVHGTRYEVDRKKASHLNKIVSYNKKIITKYETNATRSTLK